MDKALAQYLADNAEATKARFASQAAFLRANVTAGSVDSHDNSVECLIANLDRASK